MPPECEVFLELLDINKQEMQEAYANGVTANVNESFKALCKRLNVKAEFQKLYQRWLIEELKFNAEKVPDGYGKFLTTGTRFPNPHGVQAWEIYKQNSGLVGLAGDQLTLALCKQAEANAKS